MIYFIIQARCGSTRLPNKILLPFYRGESIIDLLIEKLKQIDGTKIIIATSINPNCDEIEHVAKKHDIICFRGSENDVLQRFIDAAEVHHAEKIIRVCSDNPFLELKSIKKLVKLAQIENESIDYISFKINNTPSIMTHYGFWTEFVTLNALKLVKNFTNISHYHEHVTNFIYTHPELFNVDWIEVTNVLNNHKDIRLTIDTKDDLENAKRIYAELCDNNPYPTIEEIISFLDKHNEYYVSMKTQIEKNNK